MMKFTYHKKSYMLVDNTIYDHKGQEVKKDLKEIFNFFYKYQDKLKDKGFIHNMPYQEFNRYIDILTSKEKNMLFHKIFGFYMYTNSFINRKGCSANEYYRGLARIKRYERYLFLIIES